MGRTEMNTDHLSTDEMKEILQAVHKDILVVYSGGVRLGDDLLACDDLEELNEEYEFWYRALQTRGELLGWSEWQ